MNVLTSVHVCLINCLVCAVCMKGMCKDTPEGILTRLGWSYKLSSPINLSPDQSSYTGYVLRFVAILVIS